MNPWLTEALGIGVLDPGGGVLGPALLVGGAGAGVMSRWGRGVDSALLQRVRPVWRWPARVSGCHPADLSPAAAAAPALTEGPLGLRGGGEVPPVPSRPLTSPSLALTWSLPRCSAYGDWPRWPPTPLTCIRRLHPPCGHVAWAS